MPSPDLLDRIEEQSRIARRAIAEAQAVIADTIAALEQAIRAAAPDAEMRHMERADPRCRGAHSRASQPPEAGA